jgi:adenine-specific DNA-methyltransferase
VAQSVSHGIVGTLHEGHGRLLISPIRYMGSKRSLAPRIADLIRRLSPSAVVIDVFAGTCAVASELARDHYVIANDIHAFAETIARALLVSSSSIPLPTEAWNELRNRYSSNVEVLEPALRGRLAAERRTLVGLGSTRGWRNFLEFTQAELEQPAPIDVGLPPTAALRRARRRGLKPFGLFSTYYANTYFGVRQCMEIDSLRYAIEHASSGHRDYYMLALLHALSACAAAPGHFAQYLVPRDERNSRHIGRVRQRSILHYFGEALLGFSRPSARDRSRNRVSRSDATDFLEQMSTRGQQTRLAIYADPPYSRAQYSRYYHILETLSLYDYPEVPGKARYRIGRVNTDFSRKGKVAMAMERFVRAAARTGAALYLSYPRNGLLGDTGCGVGEILRRHYRRVRVAMSVSLRHSTLGSAPGYQSLAVVEDVYHAVP